MCNILNWVIFLNIIDRGFKEFVLEIKSKNEKEIYYNIRRKFEVIPEETKRSLEKFFDNFDYWGKLDVSNDVYEEIENKEICLYNHIDDFIWLYDNLADYRSKKTLYSILNNWYNYDFALSASTIEYMYDDYFDLDLVKCDSNEVIVDLGAYIGDTVLSYIKNYGKESYKKIYCYEVTSSSFDILRENLKDYKNIDFRFKGVSDSVGLMRLVDNKESTSANTVVSDDEGDVVVTTLDEDIKEKVTLIKADIEGSEVAAIKGARRHIINDHPKLLISVYHSNDDLWKIPKMIYEMDSSYKFYLRYKSTCVYPTEITLIAI